MSSRLPTLVSDPIKIKPIAPSLTQSASKTPVKRKRSFPWALALIPVVLVLAYLAFQYVPTKIVTPSDVASQNNPIKDSLEGEETTTPSNIAVLPFRDVELERAQERAKAILYEFSQLQDQVEFEELGLKRFQADYDAIIDAANQADASFARREYDVAIAEYRAATQDLRNFVLDRQHEFEDAFAAGTAALIDRDVNTATTSLQIANEIRPNEPEVAVALARLEKLPEVNRLIREAQRATLRGEYQNAETLYLDALDLDPATQGIDTKLTELQIAQSEDQFKAIVTQGRDALKQNQLIAAKDYFERALRMRPNDAAAKTGLSEASNRLANTSIADLKHEAESLERDGNLQSALNTYVRALSIDNNLQFARDGKQRTETSIRLLKAIERVIADPDMLSSNKEYEAAQNTLNEARAHDPIRVAHASKISKLADLIAVASKPLQLVLVSDNEMEVRLATVGDLGPFDRKELSLRPGRYLLTGSGNGCRDVRKTIVVTKGMSPVAIVCNEPI